VKILTLIFLYILIGFIYGDQLSLIKLDVVEDVNNEGENFIYKGIECEYSLVYDLESRSNKIIMRLVNNSLKEVKISRGKLLLDDSYLVKIDNNELSTNLYNHQVFEAMEKGRERKGLRWLVLQSGQEINIILKISHFSQLQPDNFDEKLVELSFKSLLFPGPVVNLSLKKISQPQEPK